MVSNKFIDYRKGLHLLAMLLLTAVSLASVSPALSAEADGLSADQKNRLRAVMTDAKKDTGEMYQQLRQARHQLGELYDSYQLDGGRINDVMRRINAVQNQIQRRHLRTQQEIRRIVTPAQFAELKRHMNEMRDRRNKDRRGRHRRDRDRPDNL